MQGIEDCLFAIGVAAAIGAAQADAANIQPLMQQEKLQGVAELVDEWHSKQLLAGAGLSIPDGRTCGADDAAAVAAALGFPVVLKAVSGELAHKSEVGAVALGLGDTAAVRTAMDRMRGLSGQFLVEKMIGGAVAELIIGVTRDNIFGLTLLIGAGGTLVELLADTASLLLPAQRSDIAAALESLKVSTLLHGYRGGPAGDIEAVLDAIEAIAAYAVANADTLQELDVNPLLVTASGAVAVDALIRIADTRARH